MVEQLKVFDEKFRAIRIPDTEIAVTPAEDIQQALEGLAGLKEELFSYLRESSAEGPKTAHKREKLKDLLDSIVRETKVYEQFVGASRPTLTLEAILDEADNTGTFDHGDWASHVHAHNLDLYSDEVVTPGFTTVIMPITQNCQDAKSDRSRGELSLASTLSPSALADNELSSPHQPWPTSRESRTRDPIFVPPSPDEQTPPFILGPSSHVSSDIGESSLAASMLPALETNGLTALDSGYIPSGPLDVFKWIPLQRLSDQVFADTARQNIGTVTVIAVNNLIAIGTSRSIILLFDSNQSLKAILGDISNAPEFGSVTSVAISPNQTVVAAGHKEGVISLWDTHTGANIKTIVPFQPQLGLKPSLKDRDLHVKGIAIIHISFTSQSSEIVSADEKGTILLHRLSKVMMVSSVRSIRLHGIPNGESASTVPTTVFSLATITYLNSRRSQRTSNLLAFTTPYKLQVMGFHPRPEIKYKIVWSKMHQHGGNTPFLAQNIPTSRQGESHVHTSESTPFGLMASVAWGPIRIGKDPLACSWSNVLMLTEFQFTSSQSAKDSSSLNVLAPDGRNGNQKHMKFVHLTDHTTSNTIAALIWLNARHLVIMEQNEQMTIFDAEKFTFAEICDIRSKEIVYHDLFRKQLGQTSGSPGVAYHHSIKAYQGHLFVLGFRSIYAVSLIPWQDRLVAAIKAGSFTTAVHMALEFASGESSHIATGIPDDPVSRKEILGDYIMDMLKSHVTLSLSTSNSDQDAFNVNLVAGNISETSSTDHNDVVRHLAQICIKTSLEISRDDELFDDIFELFADAGMDSVFFEQLEPYILGDKFVGGIKNATIAQGLLNFYTKHGLYKRLEECLLHMHPAVLNIDEILNICEDQKLYVASTYVYTQGLNDFTSPLMQLLKPMGDMLELSPQLVLPQNGDDHAYLAYVYLSFILSGRNFPNGDSMGPQSLAAKREIYSILFSKDKKSESLGQSSKWYNSVPFPYLYLLIKYDAGQFFAMLATVFEDASLSGEIFVNLQLSGTSSEDTQTIAVEMNRQFIVDNLILLLTPWLQSTQNSHSEAQTGYGSFDEDIALHFMCFLASSLSKFSTFVTLDGIQGKQILTQLLLPSDIMKAERQHAVELLLDYFTLEEVGLSVETIITMAEAAAFFQIAEKLLRITSQPHRVIDCYLLDENRKALVFNAIKDLVASYPLSFAAIESATFSIIYQLVELNPARTAKLVAQTFNDQHTRVLKCLTASKPLEYKYLQVLMNHNYEFRSGEDIKSSFLSNGEVFESPLYDRYIELLCQFEPSAVKPFLVLLDTTFEDCVYDLGIIQELTQKYKLAGATAWVYERTGDTFGAMQLLIEVFEGDAANLLDTIRASLQDQRKSKASPKYDDDSLDWMGVYGGDQTDHSPTRATELINNANTSLQELINFCQRSTKKLPPEECEQFWAKVLDAIMQLQKQLSSLSPSQLQNPDISGFARKGLQTVLNGMLGFTAIPPVLFKIIKEQSGTLFSDIRDVIFTFLLTHEYEESLVEVTTKLLASNADHKLVGFLKMRSKALRPRKGICKHFIVGWVGGECAIECYWSS
ncbi:hypothetical protein M427DRAFT_43363 [Gonapodya prolifera JEL478]|uniref:Vacuolar protein sorting-associated protein 8 central domain-containing protein n=1 Tax=Gonapodya prolifera (strain JEL478) TaxID=1344416 RepID=A0A139AK74_GONPJ|nr:hypothetical protein M427DRAFT_43363 [Gonapodya prolifera JEL478]|eukprot:KXS16825.1 hypothetical protein M427DRAFT_43363 [Gonapodya prolifera JEL478]